MKLCVHRLLSIQVVLIAGETGCGKTTQVCIHISRSKHFSVIQSVVHLSISSLSCQIVCFQNVEQFIYLFWFRFIEFSFLGKFKAREIGITGCKVHLVTEVRTIGCSSGSSIHTRSYVGSEEGLQNYLHSTAAYFSYLGFVLFDPIAVR